MTTLQGTKRRIIAERELTDHEKKNLMILEIIRRKGPIARADIARLIELNNVTVTSYVDQYLRKKILQEAGVHISTGGRKPTLVDLDPTVGFAIGVGLNAADFIAVLCDLKGKSLRKVKLQRTAETNLNPVEAVLEVIDHLIRESSVDISRVHGIGVGVPGIVDQQNGTVRWPRGLLHRDLSISVSISNRIHERFGLPVILDNDANTAVFAEQWISENGLNVDSAVYLYSGSGCGLLINGQIYRGHTGSAGEFLFDLATEDPVAWLKNAVETGDWAIDLGITLRARQELSYHKESRIFELAGGDPKSVDLNIITEAAELGDPLAVKILTDAGNVLGFKAAMVVNLLNCELIIVGGGLEAAGVVFLDAVRNRIKDLAVPEATSKLRVVPSQLGEDAVPLGAAALVIQDYFVTA